MNPTIQLLIILAGALLLIATWRSLTRSERWAKARRRFQKDKLGKTCLVVITIYFGIALMDCIPVQNRTLLDWCFASVPKEKSYSAPMATTSYSGAKSTPLHGRHPLGTDIFGKDVLHQTLKAMRTAMFIGGLTSLIYIPLGTLLGIAAGFYKKRVDDLIHYVYSTLASIPNILLLIAILMVLGKGLFQMCFALGITGWVGLCRLIRGETFRQSERAYTEAARALGQTNGKIIVRHILPNVMHLVVINFVLGFSGLVLAESILSYLGVGVPVGHASWGLMIDSARMELSRDPSVWWNLTAATTALFILVLSLNLLGDSLRRAFDPKA